MKLHRWLRFGSTTEEGDVASLVRKIRDSDPDILVLTDDQNGERFIRVDLSERRYYDCFFDSPHSTRSTFEYRIEGTKVFQRLIEHCEDDPEVRVSGQYWVKDGVVLESEIPESEVLREFNIVEYRQAVEWHEIQDTSIAYFVLSRHPETISPSEVRRFFRQELERIRLGNNNFLKRAAEMGAVPFETKEGHYELRFPEDMARSDSPALDEHRDEIHQIYEHILGSCQISFAEFHDRKRLEDFLHTALETDDSKSAAQ